LKGFFSKKSLVELEIFRLKPHPYKSKILL
jgi:hypothetical protein